MTDSVKQWMAAVPWDSVVTINRALCQTQKTEPLTNPETFEAARRLWEKSVNCSLPLMDAFDVCREAHQLSAFLFNNGNTFAALGHTMVENQLRSLPPVEAQILRTTIGHYICGLIGRRELQQVLRHLTPLLGSEPAPAPVTPAPTQTQAQVSPAPASVPLGLPREQRA